MKRHDEMKVTSEMVNSVDFIRRNRSRSLWRAVGFYLICLALVAVVYILQSGSDSTVSPFLLLIVSMSFVTVYSLMSMQRNLDLVTSIEFQNAIFSSAFKHDKVFSLVINSEDQMYYADADFCRMFPSLAKRSAQVVETLLRDSADKQEALARLSRVFEEGEYAHFDTHVMAEDKQLWVRITIYPLMRPRGYFFVSAREYTGSRHDPSAPPQIVRPEDVENVLSAMISNESDCVYVIDMNGKILQSSKALSHVLGYSSPSDLIGVEVTDLLYNTESYSDNEYAAQPFDHDKIAMKRKAGILQPVKVTHTLVTNSVGHPWMVIGKVLPL